MLKNLAEKHFWKKGEKLTKNLIKTWARVPKKQLRAIFNDMPRKMLAVISGGSRKFWWGGFEAQNLKNSDVFTKIESDFSAEIENSNVFSPKIRWSPKKKKGLHQNWEWFFGQNRKFQRFFAQTQVVSKKKKKKKVFTKIETDFSPDSLRLGRWRGMHSEMEPNYSK